MIEKIVEMFAPEVVVIAIIALAVLTLLTFLMMLIQVVSLQKVRKRLLIIAEKSLALEEKQAAFRQDAQMVNNTIANLAQTADKIESIEYRLNDFDQKIVESQNLLAGLESTFKEHESTLKEHESILKGHESTLKELEFPLKENESTLKKLESRFTEYESTLKEHDTLLGKAGQMMGKEAAGFTQVVQRIRILEDEFLSLKVFQRTFEITRSQILNVLVGMPISMPSHNILPSEFKTFNEENLASSDSKTPDADDGHNPRMSRF